MVVSSSGGAQTSTINDDDEAADGDTEAQDTPPTTAPEVPEPPAVPEVPVVSEAPIEEPTADAAPAGDPTTSTIEESDPPETESDSPRAAESTVKPEAIKIPEESSPTQRTTLARTAAVPDDVPTTALTMAAADVQANALSAHQATAAAVAPAGPVTGLSNLASNFVAAVLSPFLAPGPTAPAQAPVLWAVLAWVRRGVSAPP